jgi:HK97 family phage major capsid protein
MTDLLTTVRTAREGAWREAKSLLDAAERGGRDLTDAEKRTFDRLDAEIVQADARIADLDARASQGAAMQRTLDRVTGQPVTRPAGIASEDRAAVDGLASMILERNPKPVEMRDAAPKFRSQPGLETRDLLKSAPANYSPVSFYRQIVTAMVESSAVLRAGATMLTTETGEDLRIPRHTGFSTAALVTEGAAIGESDPTLSLVTLGAYKYGVLVQVSSELMADSGVDMQNYLAMQTGTALGLALGNHLVNGTGTAQPRGILADTTVGITGPTGTTVSFGAQGTAGQGTDLLNSLAGSLAEPYVQTPSTAFLLRNATLTAIRNLKTTAGDLVGNSFLSQSPWPFYVDPFVPAMAANAKSVIFGDWSRYFVRMVNGIRFERSDDFAFSTDLVTFRAIIRADASLIDNTGAIKHFANSAT